MPVRLFAVESHGHKTFIKPKPRSTYHSLFADSSLVLGCKYKDFDSYQLSIA